MSKRVVVVTGGATGIGAEIVRRTAREDWAICFNYRHSHKEAEDLKEELLASGRDVLPVEADVSLEAEVTRLFNAVDQRWGRLDALVNNAGLLEPQCRVESVTDDRLQRLFSTNVIGAFLCSREAIRRMSSKRGGSGGSIVNVSSAASRWGAAGEYVDYAASKGAMDTMTIGLAAEVASEGIRVNAVRPAFIHTRIHALGGEPGRIERLTPSIPMGRGGTPEEVAAAITWLLSDDASYVTGALIDMAGGKA